MYKRLSIIAVFWTFCLVVLGAYVRLSDAGLGCPDWPGCYGHPTPTQALNEIGRAMASDPNGPVTVAKAWKEIIHRMFAGGLVLLTVLLAFFAVRQKGQLRQSPMLNLAIVGLIIVQAAFGMWTVTLRLMPAIVLTHLLLGLTTFALLAWSALRLRDWKSVRREAGSLRTAAIIGLLLLICQITLGGWVSTNYAATACDDFPTCGGKLIPNMEFKDSFRVDRDLGQAPDGHYLGLENLRAIHWMHRAGAVVTFAYLTWLILRLRQRYILRRLALLTGIVLFVQVLLGIGNVMLRLPLPVAVMHNAGATLLLGLVVTLNFRLANRS